MPSAITLRLKTNEGKQLLICDAVESFDFALNSEKQKIEVYKNGKFLGYYLEVLGMSEESLIEYAHNCWKDLDK